MRFIILLFSLSASVLCQSNRYSNYRGINYNRGENYHRENFNRGDYHSQFLRPRAKEHMSPQDISNVLHFIQGITEQVAQAHLRSGDPNEAPPIVEIKGGQDNEVQVKVEGTVAEQLSQAIGSEALKQQNDKLAERQGHLRSGEPVLALAGNSIVFPGSGPKIELRLEGDLAEELKQTKISDLNFPDSFKTHLISTLSAPIGRDSSYVPYARTYLNQPIAGDDYFKQKK